MKKLWILIAAALLALGMMAMAQNKPKADHPPSAPVSTDQQGMSQDPGDAPEMMADVEESGDFDFSDDQPDMAPDMDQPGGGGPMMGMGHRGWGARIAGMWHRMFNRGDRAAMMMRLADKLELTDAQKAQFEKLRTDFQLSQVDRRAELQKAQIKLRGLMRDDKSADADVLKGIDEVARIRTDMAKARFSHMRQMRGVLTDKQRDTLKTLIHDRTQSGMQGRAGRMGRDGNQPPNQEQHRGNSN